MEMERSTKACGGEYVLVHVHHHHHLASFLDMGITKPNTHTMGQVGLPLLGRFKTAYRPQLLSSETSLHFLMGWDWSWVDMDKYRLVGIPPAVVSCNMLDWQEFGRHRECNHHKQNVFACELHMHNKHTSEPLELCRTAASQNHHSCQFAAKWGERGYYDKSDVALCVK